MPGGEGAPPRRRPPARAAPACRGTGPRRPLATTTTVSSIVSPASPWNRIAVCSSTMYGPTRPVTMWNRSHDAVLPQRASRAQLAQRVQGRGHQHEDEAGDADAVADQLGRGGEAARLRVGDHVERGDGDDGRERVPELAAAAGGPRGGARPRSTAAPRPRVIARLPAAPLRRPGTAGLPVRPEAVARSRRSAPRRLERAPRPPVTSTRRLDELLQRERERLVAHHDGAGDGVLAQRERGRGRRRAAPPRSPARRAPTRSGCRRARGPRGRRPCRCPPCR